MITNAQRTAAVETSDNILDAQRPPAIVHRNLATACTDSARNWREIGRKFLDTDLQLAIFAQQCAWDNERIAAEEAKQLNPLDGRKSI